MKLNEWVMQAVPVQLLTQEGVQAVASAADNAALVWLANSCATRTLQRIDVLRALGQEPNLEFELTSGYLTIICTAIIGTALQGVPDEFAVVLQRFRQD